MSVQALRKLIEEQEPAVRDFRDRLKPHPLMLDRAETAWRIYVKVKDRLWEQAPNFHETRGLHAGLSLSAPYIDAEKAMVKKDVEEEKIDTLVGKEQIARLHAARGRVATGVLERAKEVERENGKTSASVAAAEDAIAEIAMILAQVERGAEFEDDEDPDGPGHNARRQAAAGKKGGGKKKTARVRRAPPNGAPAGG